MGDVKASIEQAVAHLSEHPDEARYTDSSATARLGDALRVQVEGPSGERLVTDMAGGVGGRGEHPSPGWLFRAAVASCVASTVGMEAAREGVDLGEVEVVVDSESDDRGILGMEESVPPGPLSLRIRVRLRGGEASKRAAEVAHRGAARCPVCDATKRAVEVSVEVE